MTDPKDPLSEDRKAYARHRAQTEASCCEGSLNHDYGTTVLALLDRVEELDGLLETEARAWDEAAREESRAAIAASYRIRARLLRSALRPTQPPQRGPNKGEKT